MKNAILVLMLLLIGSAIQAQPRQRGGDPKARAEKTAQMMADSLTLSDAQQAKAEEILLKYSSKMTEARQNADGDWEALRESMQTLRQDQEKELRQILTTDQYDRWKALRSEMRMRRGQGRQGKDGGKGKRGGRKNPPPPPPPAPEGEGSQVPPPPPPPPAPEGGGSGR